MTGDHRAADHRTMPRRRGKALDDAILHATLDELTEVGYANLTMERVAERAGTGKASLYRRWPSRIELAYDAVRHALPDLTSPPDTGSLRGDLLALMRAMAHAMDGPTGEAIRGLLSDALADGKRLAELRRNSQSSSRRAMHEIVRRAVERGEIEERTVTPSRLDVAPALLRHHFLFNAGRVPDGVILDVVDDIVIPLLHAPAP
ncbi:TetR/AcrR family transcriptional regulator [Streptomyces sp. NPDC058525]|uniref:TetR/AcrR family transcriptional regulator n=1 Tax=Streptomyces sp. NPDC058525 TaxID=3346538 RepID=UPI0036474828